MADDEHFEGTQDGEEQSTAEDSTTSKKSASESEAKKAMEEAKRKHAERQAQELAEYEEMRREERAKEADEIERLRQKRIERRKDREEEEKRLAEKRKEEEAKRKAEEEERKRKKEEEARTVREERDRKKKEAEERARPKKPNFVITKRSNSEKGSGEMDVSKESVQKSKEQLEEEKRAILSQRIQPLNVESLDNAKLLEKARELHEHIRKLETDKYDLEQRFKRQQYDMIELAERARQMNKGKGKRNLASVQVDESFDRLADKYKSAPPKIQLCSKYERHTDHRTYDERKVLFEDLAKDVPPPEIQHVAAPWKPEGDEEAEAPAAAE